MCPVLGCALTGLADLTIQAQVADELARAREAADVTDGREERRGDDHVDAGHGHQAFDVWPLQRVERDQPLDLGDLCVQKADLPQTGVDGLALLDGKSLFGQPPPALDAEQIAGWRAPLQPAHQDGVNLVLDTRPGDDELVATGKPATHHARALIGHPDRIQRPGRQQLGQRERVEKISLRTRLTDPGIAGRHDDHPGHVRLEDPRDLPRVTGHLERHLVIGCEALGEQLQVLRRARDTPPLAATAAIEDRDLAEVAMHIQADRSHHYPLSSLDRSGEPVGKRHRRIRARSATGQVAGAATEKPGSQPIVQEPACPTCVLPEGPCPSRATVTTDPDAASEKQFHAPNRSSLRQRRRNHPLARKAQASGGPGDERSRRPPAWSCLNGTVSLSLSPAS